MSIFCANVIAGSLQGVFYLVNQGYQRQLFPCWDKGESWGIGLCIWSAVSGR